MPPQLVLSSSLGTTRRMWDPNVAGLSARYEVIRYDHPGHGDAPIADVDLREDLGRIEVPTTVIVGREDAVIDGERKRLLAQVGEVIELDAAHLAIVERPDEFNDAVLSA